MSCGKITGCCLCMSTMFKEKNPENHLRSYNQRAFEAALCDVIRVRENDARKTTRHEKSMATRRCCCCLLKKVPFVCSLEAFL